MNLTRTEAVAMSIKKWEAIVAGGKEGETRCGFCDYKEEQEYDCAACPLQRGGVDLCDDNGTYQQWENSGRTDLAQEMLDGIKKVGKEWIEEEVK